MSKQVKITIGIIIVLLIILAIFGFSKSSAPVEAGPIKIGAILPLTGQIASIGESVQKGINMSYEELPDEIKERIQIIFENDNFEAKNTVLAFNKLVDTDGASVIICVASGTCNAIATLADEREIPLIALASAPVQVGRSFVVRLEASMIEEAKKLAQYLEQKDYKKIASVVAMQDAVQSGYEELLSKDTFSSKEVASATVGPDENNFQTVLTKTLKEEPDLILVALLPGQAGEFAKQARNLGYKGDLVGFNTIEGENTIVAAQGSIDGIVFTQVSSAEGWFEEKYKALYGAYSEPGSAHAYDVIKLISNVLKAKNKVDSNTINDYLHNVKNFSGALGECGSNGVGEFTLPVVFRTVKDGKFITLE